MYPTGTNGTVQQKSYVDAQAPIYFISASTGNVEGLTRGNITRDFTAFLDAFIDSFFAQCSTLWADPDVREGREPVDLEANLCTGYHYSSSPPPPSSPSPSAPSSDFAAAVTSSSTCTAALSACSDGADLYNSSATATARYTSQ